MSTLNVHGRLIMVAMPDEDLPSLMSSGKYTYLIHRFLGSRILVPDLDIFQTLRKMERFLVVVKCKLLRFLLCLSY